MTVVSQNLNVEEIEAATKKMAEKNKVQVFQIDPALVAKAAAKKTKHEIPEKYSWPRPRASRPR